MIKPTVGRVVIFRVAGNPEEFAAIVAKVHSERCVNLMVIDSIGNASPRQSVELLQDEDPPSGRPCWCEWMPYHPPRAHRK